MAKSENRPRPGPPPELGGPIETLQYLLDVEKVRLTVALRIEEERKIVFPETSVIVHDIEKLLGAIEKEREKAVESERRANRRAGCLGKKAGR